MEDEAQVELDPHKCQYCGSQTRDDIVNMALWEEGGKRLVIIADVPARICEKCYEQFYDDDTLFKVDKLRAIRFPVQKAREVMQVPVFSLTNTDIELQSTQPADTATTQDRGGRKDVFAGRKKPAKHGRNTSQ